MRTVVFSDERVALVFNASFVNVWENQNLRARFSDHPPKPEKYLYEPDEDLPLGTGETNVVSVFATPGGQVLNAVPGYLDAETLLDEMRLALAVRKLALDAEDKPLPGASKSYAGLHRAAAKLYGDHALGRAHRILAKQGMATLAMMQRFSSVEKPGEAFQRLFRDPDDRYRMPCRE